MQRRTCLRNVRRAIRWVTANASCVSTVRIASASHHASSFLCCATFYSLSAKRSGLCSCIHSMRHLGQRSSAEQHLYFAKAIHGVIVPLRASAHTVCGRSSPPAQPLTFGQRSRLPTLEPHQGLVPRIRRRQSRGARVELLQPREGRSAALLLEQRRLRQAWCGSTSACACVHGMASTR